MEDNFGKSFDAIPGKILSEKEIDEEQDYEIPSDLELLWLRGAELNEEIVEKETQKFLERLKNDDFPDYGEARVCIHIAIWRSDDILKIIEQEELKEDAYISLRDTLSILKGSWIINRFSEREVIRLYRGWWVLGEKYRSKILDVLINTWLLETEVKRSEVQAYQKFRGRIFSYL